MRLASPRFLWLLAPLAALVLASWFYLNVLTRREAALARETASLRTSLRDGGFEPDADRIERRRAVVRAETARLNAYNDLGQLLQAALLVKDHGNQPFQLIEFERERAAAAQTAREQAAAAGVKLDPSAFGVLADNSESPAQPRRRWAQLAIAKEAVARAIAVKVATYEALPVPAAREMRVDKVTPVLAEEILFTVRVTGEGARVQDFVESLALGEQADAPRFFIEHLVLRKDGTNAPDLASATVVLAALLPPALPDATPASSTVPTPSP